MATLREAIESIGRDDIRHVVSVSGGKDSAALALYLKQRYPQIPAEYVFCDTGAELPETYDYLERLEDRLEAPIVRLDALELAGVRKKPGRTAFDVWLNEVYGGFLPSPRSRWCTRVLKIRPFECHVGEDRAFSYIGIRGDEDREGYVGRKPPQFSDQENILPVYPFRDDAIGLQDVESLLVESGLGMPSYYEWRSRSGCYFCFYQQIAEWQGLRREHPDLFERAKGYEREEGGRQFTWVQGRTLDEVADAPSRSIREADPAGCAICHL